MHAKKKAIAKKSSMRSCMFVVNTLSLSGRRAIHAKVANVETRCENSAVKSCGWKEFSDPSHPEYRILKIMLHINLDPVSGYFRGLTSTERVFDGGDEEGPRKKTVPKTTAKLPPQHSSAVVINKALAPRGIAVYNATSVFVSDSIGCKVMRLSLGQQQQPGHAELEIGGGENAPGDDQVGGGGGQPGKRDSCRPFGPEDGSFTQAKFWYQKLRMKNGL
eukprot:jgi/Bigna1/75368/fgenesh1_pg.34_\